jgi:hypothetical protein
MGDIGPAAMWTMFTGTHHERDITALEVARDVAEAERLAMQVTPEEHRESMGRFAAAFRRRAAATSDPDRRAIALRLAEVAEQEARPPGIDIEHGPASIWHDPIIRHPVDLVDPPEPWESQG